MKTLLAFLAICGSAYATGTTITDTIYKADGVTPCTGYISATGASVYVDGKQIAASTVRASVKAGVFSIVLEPGSYTVSYQMQAAGCTPANEFWNFASSVTPLNLNAVRVSNLPTPITLVPMSLLSTGGVSSNFGAIAQDYFTNYGNGSAPNVFGSNSATDTAGLIGIQENARVATGLFGVGITDANTGIGYGFGADAWSTAATGHTNLIAGFCEGGNAGAATVDLIHCLDVGQLGNNGGGSITNNFGVYVNDMNQGVNNWAIFTNAGRVEFTDKVILHNSFAPGTVGTADGELGRLKTTTPAMVQVFDSSTGIARNITLPGYVTYSGTAANAAVSAATLFTPSSAALQVWDVKAALHETTPGTGCSGNYAVTITWNDGSSNSYTLATLAWAASISPASGSAQGARTSAAMQIQQTSASAPTYAVSIPSTCSGMQYAWSVSAARLN